MPNVIRVIASLLLLAIVVLSVFGWEWAARSTPPQPIGGRVVLALGILASLAALLRLWTAGTGSR